MKIAMIISTAFPPEEGIGFYVYNLSRELIKKGHEVTVITRGSLKTQNEVFEGIKIIKAPFVPLYPFHVHIHGYFVNKIIKSIEDDFDIVHIHSPLAPIIKTSLPIISTLHGSMVGNAEDIEIVDLKSFGTKVLTKYISYPLVSKLIRNSSKVTTVSRQVKKEIKNYYSISDIAVLGNGVDPDEFFPSGENENYILYVGRLSYGKGLFDLLESAKIIGKNYEFRLVGKGELENKLQSEIKKQNLSNVKVLGSFKHLELVKIYQKASIFLFPSHYEGFPTVVLEAMSSGLPVIVSDIPAHKAFIEDEINGIIVKKGSPREISEKIIHLDNQRELRYKIGYEARKTVQNKFSWKIISENFEKTYMDLL